MTDNNQAPQYNGKEFKEYKWYNSHSVPLEVQIGISRLQLPIDLRVSNTQDCPRDLSVTAFLVSNQMIVHEVPISTHFAFSDEFKNSFVWDYVLSFPAKLRDLPSNAVVAFTIRTPEGKLVGGTTLRLFDEIGLLKRGKQKLVFYFGCEGDKNILHEQNKTPGDLYEKFSLWDHTFKMEKLLERYKIMMAASDSKHSDMRLDWLDRLTLNQIQNTLSFAISQHNNDGSSLTNLHASTSDSSLRSRMSSSSPGADGQPIQNTNSTGNCSGGGIYGFSAEELDLQGFCSLIVELPHYPHAVLHEDRCYPSVPQHYPPTHNSAIAQGICFENSDTGVLEFALANRPFNANSLVVIADWDIDTENLSEDMHRRMNIHSLRGNFDPQIKPNLEEKVQIDRILQRTGNHNMSYEDKDLLYRFRYSLIENKKALTKFLMAIDWADIAEVNELPQLLSLWKEKAPIDVADALKLLGRERAFEYPVIREYAVEVLQSSPDEELLMYLLQLVQALRYEPDNSNGSDRSGTLLPSPDGNISSKTALQVHASPIRKTLSKFSQGLSPLANFLIRRGCKSPIVANFLYWYLKVETEDDVAGSLFQEVLDTFMATLSNSGDGPSIVAKQLEAQDCYIGKICECQRDAKGVKGRKDVKEGALKKLLIERKLDTISSSTVSCIPLPLQPTLSVTGLNPLSVKMFTSSVYPCAIEFILEDPNKPSSHYFKLLNSVSEKREMSVIEELSQSEAFTDSWPDQQLGSNKSDLSTVRSDSFSGKSDFSGAKPALPLPLPLNHKIMFKTGDDLRQDQLIMQMIQLMDSLLKRVNLDLKLITYGILAISQNDGIMEFVSGAYQLTHILRAYNDNLADFLRYHHPDESGTMGISSAVFENFIRSTAGYCVITYILGIGDRHLDNLMMNTEGQFFHIDFGFIFGQDPKILPPPFRLTTSMVKSMGGIYSEHYAKFKSYCYQAYNWLRKSADLIINLLGLMGDAGLGDISKKSTLEKVLLKVEEKFRLDLTDEEAEHFFSGLINEAQSSMVPKVLEVFHVLSVAMK